MSGLGSSEKVRVVVSDDHPIYREGIVRALRQSSRIEVVAELADGRATLAAIREHRPHVAVLDYRMPDLDGLAVAHAVTRDALPTRILILSASDDSATVYAALAQGVSGFLTKESDRQQIVAAVIKCAQGGSVLPENLASGIASEIRQRTQGDATLLTEREMQVIKLISDGKSVPQIASELYLAPTTIKTHVQRLYEKLGVSDRGSAVAEAMRRKLVE